MRRLFLTVSILLLFSSSIYAENLKGYGMGETEKQAKTEAFSDLSQTIQVEVKSDFSRVTTTHGSDVEEWKNKIINLKSNLPLLGVEYDVRKKQDYFEADAFLDFKNITLYEKNLSDLKIVIDKNLGLVDGEKSNSGKADLLSEVLTSLDQFNKLKIVARFMGSKIIPEMKITKGEIRSKIRELEKNVDSITFGTDKIARSVKKEGIYIYPPTTKDSREITEFASAVKDALSTKIKTTASPSKAEYYLTGEYQVLENGIDLTYSLTDTKQRTLKTLVVSFMPIAYKGYEVTPKSVDFDLLLKTGVVVSGDLRADITTEKGKRELLFKDGDTFRLLVKLNKAGYFYLVVHNLKENDTYSYLVDFNDEKGNRKFIYYVNADDANKWIELGEFEIVPPFGVENLQMIASSGDLIEKVPASFYDPGTRLFKIGKSSENVMKPVEAVQRTRGFIRKDRVKKGAEKKVSNAEAVLVFTTMKKK